MSKLIPALLLVSVRALTPALAGDAADAPAVSDDTQTLAIVTAVAEEPSDTRLSRAGLGSLYWAAHHPAEAWRVLMPVQEGSVAYADVRARCAMVSNAPSGQATCP
jgi:hypothetical protein